VVLVDLMEVGEAQAGLEQVQDYLLLQEHHILLL
jgi:hypothetical protein